MNLYKFKGISVLVMNHFSTAFLQHFYGFFTGFRRLFYKLLTGGLQKKAEPPILLAPAAPQHQGYEKVISFYMCASLLDKRRVEEF
ncbi:MAG: hypothetical protein HDS35_06455 [Bacteroides sp.]|nr:hypothetical protein [Bacteroides sp.]